MCVRACVGGSGSVGRCVFACVRAFCRSGPCSGSGSGSSVSVAALAPELDDDQ